MKGILVIGHGSRVKEVNDEFIQLVSMVEEATKKQIEGANLTLAKPTVEEKVEEMYQQGVREIQIIPYFLSNGKHVIKNIPDILEKMEIKYDGLSFNVENSLLLNPLVVQAVANKIVK